MNVIELFQLGTNVQQLCGKAEIAIKAVAARRDQPLGNGPNAPKLSQHITIKEQNKYSITLSFYGLLFVCETCIMVEPQNIEGRLIVKAITGPDRTKDFRVAATFSFDRLGNVRGGADRSVRSVDEIGFLVFDSIATLCGSTELQFLPAD
jgi:hypothetical protein